MLRRLIVYWPEIFLALLVVFMVWIVGSCGSFQSCIQEHQEHIGGQTTQKGFANISATFGIYRDCTGRFVHDENAAIAALATLLIAAFTGTLWYATRDMLKASADQGKSMDRSIAESARAALQ